jgi:hypothetical protein
VRQFDFPLALRYPARYIFCVHFLQVKDKSGRKSLKYRGEYRGSVLDETKRDRD